MAIDYSLLESMGSYGDARRGIEERFLTPVIGGGRTVAVLSTPLSPATPMGWVICHSFGAEQMSLQPLEVEMARRLSANGFPVLRFHAQGYGDSDGSPSNVTLKSHVRDSLDAAQVLADQTNISTIGLIGGRFGASVAALAADRLTSSALVLWEPMLDGRRYMQSLARLAMGTNVTSDVRFRGSAQDPHEALLENGFIGVHGFPLGLGVFEEVSSFNLLESLSAFAGESLIIQIARSRKPRTDLDQLVARLKELGGSVSLEVVIDPQANTFGQQRYHEEREQADTQATLSEALLSVTTSWCGSRKVWNGQREDRHCK